MFTLKVILEIAAILLLLYGYWHEEDVIAFEQRLFARLRGTEPRKARPARAARPVRVERDLSAREPRRVA